MKSHGDAIVNPIYEWSDLNIWEYIRQNNIQVNPLYSRGYTRVGCVGCPMATYKQVMREFTDYPTYKQAYINAFQKMIDNNLTDKNRCTWKIGEEVFDWWIERWKHECKGQYSLFDEDIYG